MCKSPLHPLLARLPKCEHHVHLEGCLTPELLFRLSARNNIPVPSLPIYASAATLQAHYDQPTAFSNLQSFLDLFGLVIPLLRTEQDFYELGMTYFRRAFADNVRHAEVFFSAQGYAASAGGDVTFSTALAGFRAAKAEAEASLNMSVILIPCFLRHFPTSDAVHLYDTTLRPLLKDRTLGGIGLAATEIGYPPDLFKDLYARAVQDAIPRTAHAGEEERPWAVASALDNLRVSRVDHGRTAAEDEHLMSRLAREGTLLTLCPLSNVKLQGVKAVSDMPIRTFLEKGVRFSVNSDDPAYFGGWILDNYCAVQEAFALTPAEWEAVCRNAIEGSWCSGERKGALARELAVVLESWKAEVQAVAA